MNLKPQLAGALIFRFFCHEELLGRDEQYAIGRIDSMLDTLIYTMEPANELPC